MNLGKILIIITDSTLILSIAIVLVGCIGAIWQNIWLGKMGTKKFKTQKIRKKSIIPYIMVLFPLPFTTYTYIFFRSVTSKHPRLNFKKIPVMRNRVFNFYYKKKHYK
ncbi:hypothetical protein [Ilyobacter sp.]|uniref:hypothetical protein n=1 Tax=Ilyobacter sp. TaxID=3100343 RepID=UPI003568F1E4